MPSQNRDICKVIIAMNELRVISSYLKYGDDSKIPPGSHFVWPMSVALSRFGLFFPWLCRLYLAVKFIAQHHNKVLLGVAKFTGGLQSPNLFVTSFAFKLLCKHLW